MESQEGPSRVHRVIAEVRDRVSITNKVVILWTKLNDMCVVVGGGGVCVLRTKKATRKVPHNS